MWSLFLCKNDVLNGFLINVKLLKDIFLNSWSFAGHNILGILYFMTDTQMISYYLGAEEVALYQSVFRVLLIFMMISEIISNVLLPYLSYKFSKSEDISYLISTFFMFLLVLSCSMFLIFTTFKKEIILILYSTEYLNALPIVLPFGIVLILRSISSVFGNLLTVSNNQKQRVITVFISLLTSVTLNFIFMPLYGIVISAWISVFVHFILFSLYFHFSKKELPKINIVNKNTIQIIGFTFALYLISNVLVYNRFLSVFIGVSLWITYLYVFLLKKGNWKKLKLILDDRGI
jgi:O-antigen/teichoic acid export membrane protein